MCFIMWQIKSIVNEISAKIQNALDYLTLYDSYVLLDAKLKSQQNNRLLLTF